MHEHPDLALAVGALDRRASGRMGVAMLRDRGRLSLSPHDPATPGPWLDVEGRRWFAHGHPSHCGDARRAANPYFSAGPSASS